VHISHKSYRDKDEPFVVKLVSRPFLVVTSWYTTCRMTRGYASLPLIEAGPMVPDEMKRFNVSDMKAALDRWRQRRPNPAHISAG
jgi:hypothetical protein